jgi:addiction module HigA family antidote
MADSIRPVHPGDILREQMKELGLSANALPRILRVSANRITSIVNEQRSITADSALRLVRYFGTTAQFWMNLQSTYDLRKAELKSGDRINGEVHMRVR